MSTHTPLLNIGPYLYHPKHQIDETKMSTLWVAMEKRQAATRSAADDQVVLKIARMSDTKYSLTNQKAIENEEKWLSVLRHPNIVHLRPIAESQPSRQQIYRARSELPGNPWFLVTDFLPGGDLSSVLAERRRLPASLALEITERIADALAYLHAHNCVHCDIKPRNILFRRKPEGYALTPETQPIVIDFGIAKSPVDGRQLVSGTPRWITPEMAQAMSVGTRLEVDPSWDIYALGLVLYNVITGNKPKLDLPGSESWERIKPGDLSGDPTVTNAKALADGLNRLIAGATADEQHERLIADEFLLQVRRLRSYVQVPHGRTGDRTSPRSSGRGWWLGAGAGLAALALGAVLWFSGIGQPPQLPPSSPGAPTAESIAGGGGPVSAVPVSSLADGESAAATATDATGTDATAADLKGSESEAAPAAAEPEVIATDTPTAKPTVPAVAATVTPATPATPATLAVQATSTATRLTATPLPTSTPIPSATPLPTRTATATPNPATPTPRPAAPAAAPAAAAGSGLSDNLTVSLLQPGPNATGGGKTIFSWRPNGDMGANDCFEVRFWEGGPGSWASGFGIAQHGPAPTITVDLGATLEAALGGNKLRDGVTYLWGVLHVPCSPYKPPTRLISEARQFTYQAP